MFKRNLFVLLLLTFSLTAFACAILPDNVEAGWLESWYSQKIGSGPDYHKGQQRGYFSAGSFSVRLPTSTDHLITISKPRLNVGCGGIDLFLGGIGFLNFEYLVQKLQRLIQAAPYVAFQLAIKTITEKLGNILEAAEAIINALNQLQFNECQILEGFTMKLKDTGDISAAIAEVGQRTGITQLYKEIAERIDPASGGKTKGGSTIASSKMIEGCPNKVKDVLSGIESSNGILNAVAKRRGFLDSNVISIVRGMVGDAVIKYDNEGIPKIEPIPPCDNVIQALEKKVLLRRDSVSSSCSEESVDSFVNTVRNDLFNLRNSMESKGNIPSNSLLKYYKTPLPVFLITKTSAQSKDTLLIDTLAEPIAISYLYQALLEISHQATIDIEETYKEFAKIQKAMQNESQTQDPTKVCKVPEVQAELIKDLRENFYRAVKHVRESYMNSLSSVDKALKLVQIIGESFRIINSELANKFSPSVALRVMQ
ncbi:MAG: conjugal transfer protein TraH [Candidatus Micrarchaeia archaeon]